MYVAERRTQMALTTEQKLEKANKVLQAINEDYATTQEVAQIFSELISRFRTLDNSVTDKLDSVHSEIKEALSQKINDNNESTKGTIGSIRAEMDKLYESVKQIVPKDGKTPTEEELTELISALLPEISEIAEQASDIATNNIVKLIPEIPSVDEYRDQLELLQGDDRLDKSAIKGLENVLTKDVLDRAISILDKRTQFLINKTVYLRDVVGITVSTTAPQNPAINDLWVDIS